MVELLRGQPDPVDSAPSVESGFDKSAKAVVEDDELESFFAEPVVPPAPAVEKAEPVVPVAPAKEAPVEEEMEEEKAAPDKDFEWKEADVLLHADDHNVPVKCTYRVLVRQVKQNWPKRYHQRTPDAWYQAVRRWCIRNKLSLRKPTRTTHKNPKVKTLTSQSLLPPYASF